MQKDFKIGMLFGLGLAIAAAAWLVTRTSLSTGAKMPPLNIDDSQIQFPSQSVFGPNQPGISLSGTATEPGSGQSNVVDYTIYEQPEKIKTTKYHIVVKGQTLSEIANRYYGLANKWKKIFDANRNKIKDPNKLKPGTKLIIPD